ncbi:monocarboxylate transporter 2-like [Anthonomus grandis grandis]|uniref:monocarboxylate transporter 2-like n=1 Tax=Anthonomus grandis grandis TaxID=2921223 RepID=UPI0021664922|nr:monocarboxylate transporter 2-like [Anthonomus grandis grandis]XP_050298345.1 monocarboxylate transporter 2-like [Anthonomus grandis grandis]
MPSKMTNSGSQCHMVEQPSWSSPSASPSPPPPPLPPPVVARWARTEQNSTDSCPHCRGRLASLPTRTTSLSSYSCKDRSTPLPRPLDDEDSFHVICDRELHSLHRNIPALRRRDMDITMIKQHYYPEGGWGWLVCGAAFLAHLLTSGMQLAFGLLYLYTIKFLIKTKSEHEKEFYVMATAWLGAICLCVSFTTSPLIVAVCRRKSTRLAAFIGGLVMALACLFTSFAVKFHQALLSYGLVLGLGSGIVRETSTIVLGHYFKRRREFVEMVAQAGTGVGIALFSVLYKEGIGKLGWRLGLQAITGLLALAFFLPIVYRSANLYHPQRRAITHLKNQRRKMKEKKSSKVKKPPVFDFSPLKSRGLRVIMLSCGFGALGIYAPVFYLVYQGFREGLEDSALVLLQTFMGFASALGCVGFGLITVKPSTQCLISRQYLCQTALIGIGISLLALSAVQGYHGYVLFVWLYGICLGGFTYSLKAFALERIKNKHFTKAWSFIQGAKSIPVLLGIPLTGYINQTYPKAGYYFSFSATLIGACLMFLVGTKKEPISLQPSPAANNCNLNNCAVANLNECVCSAATYNGVCAATPELMPYRFCRQGSNHYERVFANYDDCHSKGSLLGTPHRHSYRPKPGPEIHYLPKSLSYAANIDHSVYHTPSKSQHHVPVLANVNNGSSHQDLVRFSSLPRPQHRGILRPSKSVPEGLSRWEYCGSYRRPIVRNVQVIEQITTSV